MCAKVWVGPSGRLDEAEDNIACGEKKAHVVRGETKTRLLFDRFNLLRRRKWKRPRDVLGTATKLCENVI
jgi:hypothetical protein